MYIPTTGLYVIFDARLSLQHDVLHSVVYVQTGPSSQNLAGGTLGEEADQNPCVRVQSGNNHQRYHFSEGTSRGKQHKTSILFYSSQPRCRCVISADENWFADLWSPAPWCGQNLLQENKVSPCRLQ